MAKTAADILIDTIHDWGVDVIFGLPVEERSARNVPHHTSSVWAARDGCPRPTSCGRLRAVQLECGQEDRHPGRPRRARCGDELEEVAEKLGAPIIKALLGKAAVPDDSPYTTGGIGLLGTQTVPGGDRKTAIRC